jgi:hypothetical protein
VVSDDLACDAGRGAIWPGHWMIPCHQGATNLMAITGTNGFIQLCDTHFRQILRAGLVDEPNLSPGEFLNRIEGNPDA